MPPLLNKIKPDVKNLKIAVPYNLFEDKTNSEILEKLQKVLNLLRSEKSEVENIEFKYTKYLIPIYYILSSAEASSNLARYDGVRYTNRSENYDSLNNMYLNTRSEGFRQEVKRRIMLGTFVLSSGYYKSYYEKAQKVRTIICKEIKSIFQKFNVILLPTTPTTAFKFGDKIDDPVKMYLSDVFTSLANITGTPAISIPVGFDKKHLPIGLQIIGNYFHENDLFNISYFLEKYF